MTGQIKQPADLLNCEIGKKVTLVYKTGEDYTGIFRGFDGDDTVILRSTSGKGSIGLPYDRRLDFYVEESDKNEEE